MKKAILRTGRPLTIACHIKKTYFLAAESGLAVAAESGLAVAESGLIVELSGVAGAVAAESPLGASVVPLSLQDATNAPIAKTKRSFFICSDFLYCLRMIY
jgi:hypothetical protein